MNRTFVVALALLAPPLPCLADDLPAPAGDPTAIGQVEHLGWGLTGPRARLYVFGGIAMADYRDSAGTRRIVALQHQDQIQDNQFLYYQELREGHRWALSRHRGTDGLYGVWFQLFATDPAAKPKWLPFQRRRLELGQENTPAAGIPISIPTTAAPVPLSCSGPENR